MEKSGSWFSYKGERIGQGRENARAFLKENKDVLKKIEVEVRKGLGLAPATEQAQAAAAPGAQSRVTTMPSAPVPDSKVPAARR